ncbi:MAG: recombinase family protein [Candidatus Omnitrophica bacterium]|nr:recombinase family protein [Candidatus Omnitrophota bacterium]
MRVFGYVKGLEHARQSVRQHWRECQEGAIQDYCQKNHLDLVGVFVETHPSVSLEQRPILMVMLEALKKGEAESAVVVKDGPPQEMLEAPFVVSAMDLLRVIEIRPCGVTNCLGVEGLCGNGKIIAPNICPFR